MDRNETAGRDPSAQVKGKLKMSLSKKFYTLIDDLSDEQLKDLRKHVSSAAETRRPKAAMEDIRPGMSETVKQNIYAEIQRILGEEL